MGAPGTVNPATSSMRVVGCWALPPTPPGDSDGENNNDACVPVKPKSKLILKKKIIDSATGDEIQTDDVNQFNLSASNTANDPSGVVGTNGVEGAVNPGTYQLAESPKDLGATTGYYQFGTWTCEGGDLNVGESQITLGENQTATCTVTNTRTPKVHIEKLAESPKGDNQHIGATVTADYQRKPGDRGRQRAV